MLPTQSCNDVGKCKGCQGKLCHGPLLISALRLQLWCLTKTMTEFPFAKIISDFPCGAQGRGPQGRHRVPLSAHRDLRPCLMNAGFTHGCLPCVPNHAGTCPGNAAGFLLAVGQHLLPEELSLSSCLSLQHQPLGLLWDGSHLWIRVACLGDELCPSSVKEK